MNFEVETNCSPWKKIHPTFKVHSIFHGGKKSLSKYRYKNKLFNQIRLVTIKSLAYLEVKTQLEEITFLCDISNYMKLRKYIWNAHKKRNTYYIRTTIIKDNIYKTLQFHRMIKPEYKIIDHISREGLDNREINLRETTNQKNALNCKLSKNNTSGFNGITHENKKWRFRWYENKKRKAKYFKTKEKAIEFKLAHDLTTGNMNGKLVTF
jgi:hypothetical protein